jgi:hypothetical protein
MPYLRTARACVWVDAQATGNPIKIAPSAEEVRWAKKPLPSGHGLCIGVGETSHGLLVAVKRSSATYWLAADQVLHDGELADWLHTGFWELHMK